LTSRKRLRFFPLWGALIDVIFFCASFMFSGGAHGPVGPWFVLWVINAPIAELGSRLFPFEDRWLALDPLLAFAEVAINGALYGLVAALVVALWRAIRRKRRSI
jgi:hypothetical protein